MCGSCRQLVVVAVVVPVGEKYNRDDLWILVIMMDWLCVKDMGKIWRAVDGSPGYGRERYNSDR